MSTDADLTWRKCPVCGYLVPAQQAACVQCARAGTNGSTAGPASPPPPPPPVTAPLAFPPPAFASPIPPAPPAFASPFPAAPPAGSEFLPSSGGVGVTRPRPQRRVWIVTGAAVAVVALVGGLVGSGVLDSGSSYPSKWDARLGDLPARVEQWRGLKFDHPVPVRFLSEADFKKEVGVDPKPSKSRRREMNRLTEGLRSSGLITGKVDLFKAINDEQQSSVLAFYSPDDEEIVVRGAGTPDVSRRVTLAHELTHALQDQHFDLTAMEEKVDADPQSSSTALRAFVEGDADRIESRYVRDLSVVDRRAYRKARNREASAAEDGTKTVPAVVTLEFSAPYRYGPPVLQVLANDGGNANVDRAFRRGVFTQKMFIEPSAPLTESKPRRVNDPKLRKGEKAIGESDGFGAFDLYVVLGSRISPGEAIGAASAWAGGRSQGFRFDGRTCTRIVTEARTAAGNDDLEANFELWAAALPAGMATVERRGRAVMVTSCDPGARSTLNSPDAAIETAGALLDLHSEIEAEFTKEAADAGAPASVARCLALAIAQAPEIGVIIAQPEADVDPEVARAAFETAAERVQGTCFD